MIHQPLNLLCRCSLAGVPLQAENPKRPDLELLRVRIGEIRFRPEFPAQSTLYDRLKRGLPASRKCLGFDQQIIRKIQSCFHMGQYMGLWVQVKVSAFAVCKIPIDRIGWSVTMDAATEKEKMLAGELYRASDETLTSERMLARRWCQEFNHSAWDDLAGRREILSRLLGTSHPDTFIEPSFKCDYGYNIHVGENFYANFDLVILDVCEVRIGRDCLIGPRVCIYTATHPLDAETRASGLEFGRPVRLGDRVWIGGNAVINPGVTLGDNTVVAAGSVVTQSFGNNLLIGGVPARVLKSLD